jgi:hypothetical protein
MSELVPVHQQLLDDNYWLEIYKDDTSVLKGTPLIIEGVFGVLPVLKDLTASYVRGKVRQADRSGYIPEQITNGNRLPLLDRNNGLIRTVEDARTVTSIEKLSKTDLSYLEEVDAFDEIAEEIMTNKLYRGDSANLTLIEQERNRAIKISRTVSYLTGSVTGRILVGLTSEHLSGRKALDGTEFMYPDIVGGTYLRGKDASRQTKIIQADILIPGSVSRARAKRQRKMSLSLSPILG